MCLPGSGGAALPVAQAAAPAPVRAADTANPTSLVEQAKAVSAKRMGVFGNIKTTPLGDAAYGSFARFGKAA